MIHTIFRSIFKKPHNKLFDTFKKAYAEAYVTARSVAPESVTILEEEWGDWLVSKKQLDASINHYIEAGATEKALEAAVGQNIEKKLLY